MTMRVRPAALEDLQAMLRIEQQVFGRDTWTAAQMTDELTRDSRWYAVAERIGAGQEDGQPGVVGYVGLFLSRPDADVQTIAVDAADQGRGIGRILMEAAVHHAWRVGCTRMFLEVRADNEAALALYARVGFVRLGRRARYYADRVDAITMRLRRSEPAPMGEPHV